MPWIVLFAAWLSWCACRFFTSSEPIDGGDPHEEKMATCCPEQPCHSIRCSGRLLDSVSRSRVFSAPARVASAVAGEWWCQSVLIRGASRRRCLRCDPRRWAVPNSGIVIRIHRLSSCAIQPEWPWRVTLRSSSSIPPGPLGSNSLTMWDPIYPAPPVTRMRCLMPALPDLAERLPLPGFWPWRAAESGRVPGSGR